MINEFYAPGAVKTDVRDRYITSRIAIIDYNFAAFEKSLLQEGTLGNLGVDLAVLGLSGAGAVSSSSATQRILAAVSGGLVGSKAAFDKSALFDKTLPALVTRMRAGRKTVQARILTGMTKEAEQYSLLNAQLDLQNYYDSGTIPGAILGVYEGAAEETRVAERQIESLTVTVAPDAVSTTIEEWLFDDPTDADKANPTKIPQLEACMRQTGVPTPVWAEFVMGESMAANRVEVARCLGIL